MKYSHQFKLSNTSETWRILSPQTTILYVRSNFFNRFKNYLVQQIRANVDFAPEDRTRHPLFQPFAAVS